MAPLKPWLPSRRRPRFLSAAVLVTAIACLSPVHAAPAPDDPGRAAIAVDDGIWRGMGAPPARSTHAMIYDPLRDGLVIHGGQSGLVGAHRDTWWLWLARDEWTPLGGSVPASNGHNAGIHDPLRDRMVVLLPLTAGGFAVWQLDLASGAWSEVATTGDEPGLRANYTAVLDAERDRIVLFGGYDESLAEAMKDVFVLQLSTGAWSEIASGGLSPGRRFQHSAIVDPTRDRMLVFGGLDSLETPRDDVWAFDLVSAQWSLVTTTGTVPALNGHVAIHDPLRDRMWVTGYTTGPGPTIAMYALDLATSSWSSPSTVNAPPVRSRARAVYDPVRDRLVLHGGCCFVYQSSYNDLLALDLATGTWSDLAPAPDARQWHRVVHDSQNQRMLLIGGLPLDDVWALPLTRALGPWERIETTGTPPTVARHSCVYDPPRHRVLAFGGDPSTVWSLDLATNTWSVPAVAGTPPPPRDNQSAIYDPVGDRMIVFGGYGSSGTRNDLWALQLSGTPTWVALSAAGTPPPARYLHSAIYEPAGHRMIVYGGLFASGTANSLSDAWQLSLAAPAWSQLPSSPTTRFGHAAIHDPVRQRMVVFAGGSGNPNSSGVRALSLGGAPAWTNLAPTGLTPLVRCETAAIYDPPRDRMVAFGGYFCTGFGEGPVWDDTWGLHFGAFAAVESEPARVHLSPASPNPATGWFQIDFALTSPARVRAVLRDVAGRAVRELAEGDRAAGRHHIRWDRSAPESALPAGVYFVEVTAGGARGVQRLVLVR